MELVGVGRVEARLEGREGWRAAGGLGEGLGVGGVDERLVGLERLLVVAWSLVEVWWLATMDHLVLVLQPTKVLWPIESMELAFGLQPC